MDWQGIEAGLNASGCAVTPGLLASADDLALRGLYSRGVIKRQMFGNIFHKAP